MPSEQSWEWPEKAPDDSAADVSGLVNRAGDEMSGPLSGPDGALPKNYTNKRQLDAVQAIAAAAGLTANDALSSAAGKIPSGQKGVAGGVATLDSFGKVPGAQLPTGLGGGSGLVLGDVQTTNFTAAINTFYPIDTTGGVVEVTLPNVSDGAYITLFDYAKTWDLHSALVHGNVEGSTEDFELDGGGRVDFARKSGTWKIISPTKAVDGALGDVAGMIAAEAAARASGDTSTLSAAGVAASGIADGRIGTLVTGAFIALLSTTFLGGLTDEVTQNITQYLSGFALSAKAFGVKGGAKQKYYTTTATAGSNVITTSVAHVLTSADVGKTFVHPTAGASGGPLTSTITGVGTNTIVLADNAVTSVAAVSNMISWFWDDTVNANKWTAACRSTGKAGYLPDDAYGVTGKIIVTAPTTYGTGITLFGNGHGQFGEQFQLAKSAALIIAPGIVSGMILEISSARGVNLYGFGITGGNTKPYQQVGIPNGLAMSGDPTLWLSPGFRDSRYSPQCGIAIDPFRATSTPSDGGYSGGAYSDTYVGSSGIDLQRLAIYHNVVGIMNNPAPDAAGVQGDTIRCASLRMFGASAHYAVGTSQARACAFRDCTFGAYRCVLDGLSYGNQQGQLPSLSECNLGFGWIGFKCNPNYSDVNWHNVYNEGCMHLGYSCATGGVQYPVRIIGGQHSRRGDYSPLTAAPIYLEATCEVIFEGHMQDASPNQIAALGQSTQLAYNVIGGPFHFRMGSIGCYDADKLIFGASWFGQDNLRVTDMLAQGYGAGNSRKYAGVLTPPSGMAGRYQPQQMCYANDVRAPVGPYHYVPGGSNGLLNLAGGAPSITNPGAATMTFTIAAGFLKYLQVGDHLIWQVYGHEGSPGGARRTYLVPAYKITNINSGTNTITCTALFTTTNYYDTTYSTLYLIMPEWAPMEPLTGDLASSTTISNVSPVGILKNGDWIKDFIGQIPSLTRVVSGGGTATITLSQAATTTLTGQRLGYGRLVPALPLFASKYYDPPSVAAGASATLTTLTVTGARLRDQCFPPMHSQGWGGLVVWGEITANDTMTVYAYNPTGAAIDRPGGLLWGQVQQAPV